MLAEKIRKKLTWNKNEDDQMLVSMTLFAYRKIKSLFGSLSWSLIEILLKIEIVMLAEKYTDKDQCAY